MKRISFLAVVLILVSGVFLQAQSWDNPSVARSSAELFIDFGTAATLDSAEVDTSAMFDLEDYDGGIGDFATLNYKLSSAGTPKTQIDIYGSNTPTTATMIKLDDVVTDEAATTSKFVAFDLAGTRAKYYWIVITNSATGAALTAVAMSILCQNKDAAVKN
jgi:hypothetical protein